MNRGWSGKGACGRAASAARSGGRLGRVCPALLGGGIHLFPAPGCGDPRIVANHARSHRRPEEPSDCQVAGRTAGHRPHDHADRRFRRDLQDFLAAPPGDHTSPNLLEWLKAIAEQNEGLRVLLLDRNMKVRLTYPQDDTWFGPIAQTSAAAAMKSGDAIFSDLHHHHGFGAIHLDLAIPISANRAPETAEATRSVAALPQPMGAIDIEVDPEKFLYPQIRAWPTPSETAETFLVRQEGGEVVFLSDLRYKAGAALSLKLPAQHPGGARAIGRQGASSAASHAAASPHATIVGYSAEAVAGLDLQTNPDRDTMMEGVDYRGHAVLATARNIPGTPWFIVAKVDQDEIYAPLRQQALTAAAFALSLVFVAALGLRLIGRRREAHWLHDQLAAEGEHRLILDSTDQGVLGLDRQGRLVFINPAACRMLGYATDELVGKVAHSVWHHKRADGTPYPSEECPIHRAGKLGECCRSEDEVFWRKDGTCFPVDYTAAPSLEKDRPVALVVLFRDTSERKQADLQLRLATDVLRALNRGGELDPLIDEVLHLIKDGLGLDAVGLRIREGDDCPYYRQLGFADDFVAQENSLCSREENGATVRDDAGRVVLDCGCGLVLSGRTDPQFPCFTGGGSFWTNKSTDLLALQILDDPRPNPRNHCIRRGYQSIALIPLRSGEQIIGLLQLNDCRPGRFTAEILRYLERLATSIGLAFHRKLVEEESARARTDIASFSKVRRTPM